MIEKENDRPEFTFIDLFAGVGGIRRPFQKFGGKCVFSSEIDKFAVKTYEANWHETPTGDITKVNASDIPDFDILLYCFSNLLYIHVLISNKMFLCHFDYYFLLLLCIFPLKFSKIE